MQTSERTLWIARHGNRRDFVDPDWSATAERPHDPELSADGVIQARQLARRLAREPVQHLFSSPCLRAVETAHYVALETGLPILVEAGLCEWLNPEWFPAEPAWLALEDLAGRFPEVHPTYRSRVNPRFPETPEAMLERTGRAARLLVDATEGHAVMVGHGASIAGSTLAFVPDAPRVMYGLCSLVKLVCRDSRWRVELNGDTSHLESAETAPRYH